MADRHGPETVFGAICRDGRPACLSTSSPDARTKGEMRVRVDRELRAVERRIADLERLYPTRGARAAAVRRRALRNRFLTRLAAEVIMTLVVPQLLFAVLRQFMYFGAVVFIVNGCVGLALSALIPSGWWWLHTRREAQRRTGLDLKAMPEAPPPLPTAFGVSFIGPASKTTLRFSTLDADAWISTAAPIQEGATIRIGSGAGEHEIAVVAEARWSPIGGHISILETRLAREYRRAEIVSVLAGKGECPHLSAVPVDLSTGETVAWLCPECSTQLPAEWKETGDDR